MFLPVRVQGVSDPPAFPEYADDPPEQAKMIAATVLESGTAHGNTVVGFFIETADGKRYFAQLTGPLFANLAGIHRGACERWGSQ